MSRPTALRARRRSRTSPVYIAAETGRARALDLRMAGKTYRMIAAELGLSAARSHQLVREALDDLGVVEKASDLRRLELARLDALHATHFGPALPGNVRSTEVVLKIGERRSRLLGLDRPEAPEPTRVDEKQSVQVGADFVMQRIAEMAARMQAEPSKAKPIVKRLSAERFSPQKRAGT